MKALFLDRDGTLIYDKHYLSDPDEVELIPGVVNALIQAKDLGYLLFLFTNQSGVGRGYYTLDDVHACNQQMFDLLKVDNAFFTEVCIAEEAPEQPRRYRKPSPRFIHEMTEKYSLDKNECYMVGDNIADWQAGINGKIQPIAVRTGKSLEGERGEFIAVNKVDVFEDVLCFVQSLEL